MSTRSPSPISLSESELREAEEVIRHYQTHPAEWIRTVLGITVWPGQQRVLDKIVARLEARTAGTIKVPTGHGVGKSCLAACIVLWLLSTRPAVTIPTTAPTYRQLESILWREIRRLHARGGHLIGGEPLKSFLELTPDRFAIAISTKDPTRFQGIHNELVVCVLDEASGVEPDIREAIEGVTTGPSDLKIELGNPTTPEAVFCQRLDDPPPHVDVVHISSLEAAQWNAQQPEPIPGLASLEWCQARREEWGEDSAAYQSRVLGRVPAEGSDALIRLRWIEDAMRRWEDSAHELELGEWTWQDRQCQRVVMGVDLARHGGDRIAWAIRQDLDVVYVEQWDGTDSMEKVYEHTKNLAALWAAQETRVDVGFEGHSLVDRLVRDGLNARGVNFGAKAQDEARHVNKRSEMWWTVREWLRLNLGALPPEETLLRDLLAPRYKMAKTNERFELESKEAMRKRAQAAGLKYTSPDLGDAVALALIDVLASGGEVEAVPRVSAQPLARQRRGRFAELA